MCKKIFCFSPVLTILVSCFLIISVLCAAPTSVAAKMRLTFASDSVGGTWYPMSAGLAEIWNKGIPAISITVETSGGGGTNHKWLSTRQVDIGMTSLDMFGLAKAGLDPYTKKYDMSKIGCIMLQHMAPGHWVVLKNSPIKSIRDLKGKRIAVGKRGSTANRRSLWIAEAVGLGKEDFKLEYIADQQSADALADRRIDAFVEFVGVPGPSVLNLATTTGIRFLELNREEEARFLKMHPFFVPVVVKAGTYKGQDKDFVGYGVPGCLQVRLEVPEEVVYKMCKLIDENWDFLYKVHKGFKLWKFQKDIETVSGQPLHPGAKKFYREKGLIH